MNKKKESKVVPNVRFKGFTDDWKQRKLGEVCEVTMGQSPDGSTYSDEPSDYILVQGNADLKDGWVVPRVWTSQKTKTAQAGDLIMSVRAPVGAMGKTAYDIVIGRGVAAIKGNEFIYQTLVKYDADRYWKKLAAGSTFESVNSNEVKGAIINVPQDIEEQKKIGEYFLNLDHLITLNQQKITLLTKLKKAMLEKIFPKKGSVIPEIRFNGFANAWEQRKLGNVIDVYSGRDYKHLEEGDIPVYGTGGYMLSVSEALSENEDAIGIGRKGTIDKPYILYAPFWTVDTLFYCIPRKKFDLNFIYDIYQNINWKLLDESTGVPSLSKMTIKRIEILVPSFTEQQKIGSFFKQLDHLITLHRSKIDKIRNMKKAMLDQMFI